MACTFRMVKIIYCKDKVIILAILSEHHKNPDKKTTFPEEILRRIQCKVSCVTENICTPNLPNAPQDPEPEKEPIPEKVKQEI